ncbi:MAG: 4-(cytidine 5'-diphospho)-2-C-methyl-D-erythritol kinase [Paludibacter sp.]|jgi:4-diphosphocytidyl-2-C-methyl-D-erythritol kinase|nr:4-(cytidine 5'-diphospho)-2-C-methyl-D-erythritol kinase [Paludibacter sp.]
MEIRYLPNAKINIGLYVVEKRSDGYHNLETVFYPLPLYDELVVEEKPSMKESCKLEVEGIAVTTNQEDNLIVKAYRLLEKDFSLGNTAVYLRKNIPFGAGLGGGSSDAAFMLKALNELYSLQLTDDQLEKYAVKLGADCPFFIRNRPVFATGIGNVFQPVEVSLQGYQFVLVKPDIHVSTPLAYAGIKPQPAQFSLSGSIQFPIENWKQRIENDFEKTVFEKFPRIGEIKQELYDSGALYATMSGSGSSVIGIFPQHQELRVTTGDAQVFSGVF